MKRHISNLIGLSLAVILAFNLTVPAMAESSGVRLTGGLAEAAPGGSLEFQVKLEGQVNLTCFWVEVKASPGIFTISGEEAVVQGDFSQQGTMLCNVLDPECWRITWYHTSDVACAGELFRLRLDVSPDAPAGDYPVQISYNSTNTHNLAGQSPKLSCVSGVIRVGKTPADQAVMRVAEVAPVGAGGFADITVELPQNPGLAAFKVYLECDTNVFSAIPNADGDGFQISKGNILGSEPMCSSHGSTGWVIYWFNSKNLQGTGTLFTLRLRAADDAPVGEYPVRLSVSSENTVDEEYREVGVETMDGMISIKAATLENSTVSRQMGKITAKIRLDNLPPNQSAEIYAAAYNSEGKLLQVATHPFTSKENGQAELALPETGNPARVKLMALATDGSLRPLCPAKELAL